MGKMVSKLISITEEDKALLEKIAKDKCMTSNQLIRFIIKEFLKKEV